MSKTIIIIPSRLSAKRLPNKPLLKINGISLISNVYKKALDSKVGDVYVATEDAEIFKDITKNNGKAVMTSNKHKTGTDRVYEAYQKLNLPDVDYILNLQGDEPMISPLEISNLNSKVIKLNSNIGTLASKINNNEKYLDENIVKVETYKELKKNFSSKAKNFFRKLKNTKLNKNFYHHIGIYQFKVDILKKYIRLKQSKNEIKNKLEQFRALENNIDIDVVLSNTSSIGVDTYEDYKKVKNILETKN